MRALWIWVNCAEFLGQRNLIVALLAVPYKKKWSTVSYYFTTRSRTVKILGQRAFLRIQDGNSKIRTKAMVCYSFKRYADRYLDTT